MTAPLGNQNAAKPPARRLSRLVMVRCTQADLKAWRATAVWDQVGLCAWIRKTLNKNAFMRERELRVKLD